MSRHSRPNTPLRIALAVISVLLIVVLMAVTLIYRPSWLHADTPTVERSSVGRTVSPPAAADVLPVSHDHCRYRCLWR